MRQDNSTAHETPRQASRILIVEDSFLAAVHLQAMLKEMGLSVVGPVASVEDGVALAQTEDLDAAILDVSIRGGNCLPVARALSERGCPFLFATGYGSPECTEGDWEDVPILQKPIDDKLLEKELFALLESSKSR